MKMEYDFSKGKRGPVLPSMGKTRSSIYLDDAVLEAFRGAAERTGRGYLALINEALRAQLGLSEPVLTPEVVLPP